MTKGKYIRKGVIGDVTGKDLSKIIKICRECKNPKSGLEFDLNKFTKIEKIYLVAKCKQCSREIGRKFFKENKERLTERRFNDFLRTEYKITREEYDSLRAEQGNCCFICHISFGNTRKNINLDHDHKTGKVRGLLCIFCNKALGLFLDNKASLLRAIEYLDK